jgi:GNAT superfamily N-acetyltransferase
MDECLPTIRYAIAAEAEFEQIHCLNYRGFVEEIPQHPANESKRLVDRFHEQNKYVVAICEGQMIGMIALRGTRPFSLYAKLKDLDSFLPMAKSVFELRLLYVLPEFRNSSVFFELARSVALVAKQGGYDLALVSATLRQKRLYRHLGFVAFGHQVGTPLAPYQPMWLDFSRLTKAVPRLTFI